MAFRSINNIVGPSHPRSLFLTKTKFPPSYFLPSSFLLPIVCITSSSLLPSSFYCVPSSFSLISFFLFPLVGVPSSFFLRSSGWCPCFLSLFPSSSYFCNQYSLLSSVHTLSLLILPRVCCPFFPLLLIYPQHVNTSSI